MTEPISPRADVADVSGTQRLAALRTRPRSTRSGATQVASFETLLLEASQRDTAARQAAEADGTPRTWTRPKGALGASVPGSSGTSLNAGLPGAVSFDGSTIAAATGTTAAAGTTSSQATNGQLINRGSAAGQAVVDAAKEHLGVPYLWGGTDPHNGFDCSGLVQDAYRAVGVEMPKWSRHQATMGEEVASIEEAVPGDVLTFGDPVNHVALYVGDGQMLHAPRTGEVVKIETIDRTIGSIRRIVTPDNGPAAAPAASATAPLASAGSPASAGTAATSHNPSAAELRYQPLFEAAGERWNVDPALLAAVAKTESAFNPNAVSHVGARGLMQFMPATAAEMGVDPSDPASAIDGAARYLRTSLDQFGSAELAIASYNAGRGAVSRYDGIPPFRETQNYVTKVLEAWRSRS